VIPAILKPARTLWHEIIGFLFICLAIIFVPSGVRHMQRYDGSIGSVLTISMYIFFVAVMLYYGISSFLRARKISRS